MNVLVITNLFPSSLEPTRGLFNAQPLKSLRDIQGISLRVVAPVPWFPPWKIKKSWHHFSKVPRSETWDGFVVHHPRYLVIPKICRWTYGFFYFLGIRACISKLNREFPVDVVLATWAYPDAYGSYLAVRPFKKPFFVKVHGSDINQHTRDPLRRAMIRWVLRKATRVIAVSHPLGERLRSIGIPADRIHILRNGVDTDRFYKRDQGECRLAIHLDPSEQIILFVGNLKTDKGIYVLAEAFSILRLEFSGKLRLVFVGEGPEAGALEAWVREHGLEASVTLYGCRPHDEIPLWFNACNVFCLPSFHEGCPNVILEAQACGTALVASRTGGIPDLVPDEETGALVPPGDARALATALRQALAGPDSPPGVAPPEKAMSWRDNAYSLLSTLKEASPAR